MPYEYNLNSLQEALPDMAEAPSVPSSFPFLCRNNLWPYCLHIQLRTFPWSLASLVPSFWNVLHLDTTNTTFYSRPTPFYLSPSQSSLSCPPCLNSYFLNLSPNSLLQWLFLAASQITPNLSGLKQQILIVSHIFCGSVIHQGQGWVLLLRVSQGVEASAGAARS